MIPRVNSLAAHGVNIFGHSVLLVNQRILPWAAKATLIKCSIS
jgi:hypothetical protein